MVPSTAIFVSAIPAVPFSAACLSVYLYLFIYLSTIRFSVYHQLAA
ncbi:hypothetical protein JCM19237_6608 [Photobacterium aphoticum]|uniref:Uncharacterized protein n=1 Tax=Photobacterium aphoticum TaxID=754436 RepID=A0A090QPG4_9GAMM|nr:hypothetical protein JCM19237_6608 [Photobacterium aphoticum]